MSFDEIRFPDEIAYGSSGGPMRKTQIVNLASGFEQRNTPWSSSRRKFDISFGIKSYDQLLEVIEFWEARHGQLYGFRFKDYSDFKSCPPSQTASNIDQTIAIADGVSNFYQITKTYASGSRSYVRDIKKPVTDTVVISLDDVTLAPSEYTVDYTTGIITFDNIPPLDTVIKAGYEFDVPVRFDADSIITNLANFEKGNLDAIQLIEIRV